MNKCILIIISLTLGFGTSLGQKNGVKFESTRTWEKVLNKAISEDKLIFISCYVNQCEKCKMLATEVFSQEHVGQYFNDHFINVRLDMEHDANSSKYKAAWGVNRYPTLIFIDPLTERMVGKLVGVGDANWLLKGARNSLSLENNLGIMLDRYEAGERDVEFISDLLNLLSESGMKEEASMLAKEWLEDLSIEQLATPKVWAIIEAYEDDPLSKTLLTVLDNEELFYGMDIANSKAVVVNKLAETILSTAIQFATSPTLIMIEPERYNVFMDYLAVTESPVKDVAAIWINTSSLSRAGDWKQMLEVIAIVKKENLMPDQAYDQYFNFFVGGLSKIKDMDVLEEGVCWLDEKIASYPGEDPPSCIAKLRLYSTKANFYLALGESNKFNITRSEMIRYVKLLQDYGILPRQ